MHAYIHINCNPPSQLSIHPPIHPSLHTLTISTYIAPNNALPLIIHSIHLSMDALHICVSMSVGVFAIPLPPTKLPPLPPLATPQLPTSSPSPPVAYYQFISNFNTYITDNSR